MDNDETSGGPPGPDAPADHKATPVEHPEEIVAAPPTPSAAPPGPLPEVHALHHRGAHEPRAAYVVRVADEYMGQAERVSIATLFLALVLIGFYRTFVDLMWNERPLWAIEGIRVAVFAIAMLGAAFATHHRRNFSLDLLSRYLQPRGRAILRVVLLLATLLAAALLFYGGREVQETLSRETTYELVPKWIIGWFIPLASVLIILHTVMHLVIELAYLAVGRTAPEPEQVVA